MYSSDAKGYVCQAKWVFVLPISEPLAEKVICVRFSLGGRKERRQKGLYYRVVAECLFSPTFLVNSINDLAAVICNCCVYIFNRQPLCGMSYIMYNEFLQPYTVQLPAKLFRRRGALLAIGKHFAGDSYSLWKIWITGWGCRHRRWRGGVRVRALIFTYNSVMVYNSPISNRVYNIEIVICLHFSSRASACEFGVEVVVNFASRINAARNIIC